MKDIVITLFKVEEKKHSVIYRNKDIGWSGIYIPKDTLGPERPEKIELTIRDVSVKASV